MGMGQMKNNTASTAVLEVKDADNKNYNAVYKLAKFSMSFDAMGQQQSYDSEKIEDKDSEMGKSLGNNIGKEIKLTIDKNSGKAVKEETAMPEKKEADADNPLVGMMDMLGAKDTETAIAESVFFLLPSGKKAGDSWTDSTNTAENMKGIKRYTVKSITENIATISIFSEVKGQQNIELQGMQVDINIFAKSEGEILVDTRNSLLKKSSKVADITGTMDLMGQSMPLTSKVIETTEYN